MILQSVARTKGTGTVFGFNKQLGFYNHNYQKAGHNLKTICLCYSVFCVRICNAYDTT